MADIKLKKYFENLPYGEDSLPSEIHGPKNQATINNAVRSLVEMSDAAMSSGDKDMASSAQNGIRYIARQLEDLKAIKEEYAINMGGGAMGKKLFSNWTDTRWEDEFFTERGSIDFDGDLNILLNVPHLDKPYRKIEDITENWVVKGEEESRFMQLQQDLVKERNSMNNPPSFDIDYAVNNILKTGWMSMFSDEIGGVHFLQEYLKENLDPNKDVALQLANMDLDKHSFNPEKDTRLHKFYADRLKKAHAGQTINNRSKFQQRQNFG